MCDNNKCGYNMWKNSVCVGSPLSLFAQAAIARDFCECQLWAGMSKLLFVGLMLCKQKKLFRGVNLQASQNFSSVCWGVSCAW